MLNDFFKLNPGFEEFDESRFVGQLRVSRHICNILYRPDSLQRLTIDLKKFENVSFSKTIIEKCTFKDCYFVDCLFIGTEFINVYFHDCIFENCNFNKAKMKSIYGKPVQFRKAIKDESFSNIAVHLYQQLRQNYYQESQREYKNEVEYYFSVWKRKNDFIQAKRKNQKWYKFMPKTLFSWLYCTLLGYGYRIRNLTITTLIIIFTLTIINHHFNKYFFSEPEAPTLIKSFYFTITTMATLGASGYSPLTEMGYLFVIINVLVGISILSATINSLVRKVIR